VNKVNEFDYKLQKFIFIVYIIWIKKIEKEIGQIRS